MASNNANNGNKFLNNSNNLNMNSDACKVSTKHLVLLSILFVALIPGVLLMTPGKAKLVEIGMKPMWVKDQLPLLVHGAVFFLLAKMLLKTK
jgi:hypothetical protein